MVDEQERRRPTFREGTRIRLADGQCWSLPGRWSDRADPEYDASLAAVFEAEDDAERLRAELALTILLLSRNYDLTPEQIQELLGFPPASPALAAMQRDVHAMVLEHARDVRSDAPPTSETRAQGPAGASLSGWRHLRTLWRLVHLLRNS